MPNKIRKKILIFHATIAPYRLDFFNSMTDKFNTRVCLYYKNVKSQKFNDYASMERNFRFRPIYMRYECFFLARLIFTIKNIYSYKPDIVLVSEFGIMAIVSILWRYVTFGRYKIITMMDDSYDMLQSNNQFSRKHVIARKLLLPLLDDVICVEPRVESVLKKKYGKGIFFPIIQDEKKLRVKYAEALIKSKQYVNEYDLVGKHVILFVGRLTKVKNLSFAIDVFMKTTNPNYRFIIVGGGELIEELERQAKKDKRIIFLGRKEGNDLYAWYNIADVFILPSTREAFGAVTNEALVGGCYCLISDRAGSSCLINESNGNKFSPDNKEELLDLLNCAMQNRNHGMKSSVEKLRDSNMPMTFDDYFNKLVKRIS